jgi:transcriptional regulator with XRE-family HTH domain
VFSHKDRLGEFRAELQEELDAEPIEAAPDDEQLVSRAARYFDPGDLHPITVDLILATAESTQLGKGHEERSRLRVKQAAEEVRRRPLLRVGEALHEFRRRAGVSEVNAAKRLGISRGVLKRIELGGVALLLECAPEKVATYVVSLGLDAKRVLEALYATLRPTPSHPRSTYGYAASFRLARQLPPAERRASEPEEGTPETHWAVTFLLRAEHERYHQ